MSTLETRLKNAEKRIFEAAESGERRAMVWQQSIDDMGVPVARKFARDESNAIDARMRAAWLCWNKSRGKNKATAKDLFAKIIEERMENILFDAEHAWHGMPEVQHAHMVEAKKLQTTVKMLAEGKQIDAPQISVYIDQSEYCIPADADDKQALMMYMDMLSPKSATL